MKIIPPRTCARLPRTSVTTDRLSAGIQIDARCSAPNLTPTTPIYMASRDGSSSTYSTRKRSWGRIIHPRPSECSRKARCKEFGEYRTQRLVLEAWDRFVADGTFDVGRLRDPQYIDRVADELSKTRARLEETEGNQRALLILAAATPKPTLFVEGITDVSIIEAAWSVFFPNEPIPVKVLSAGGTKEMGSLAGPGKALREVLGK